MIVLVGLCLAILATAPVNVIAAPNLLSPTSVKDWSHYPSQNCHTQKHCAQADAEIFALPGPQAHSHNRSVFNVCLLHGHRCYKAKHHAKNISRILDIYGVAGSPTGPDIGKSDGKGIAKSYDQSPVPLKRWCRRPGQGCYKVKRATSGIAKVSDERFYFKCSYPGYGCRKARRPTKILAEATVDAQFEI